MVAKRVLITGGAGFIGSHLANALLAQGHDVTILDSLVPQVHGKEQQAPPYLPQAARFIRGDVRDRRTLAQVIEKIDIIFHQAAEVGVGQSMYEIERYTGANVGGTATLLGLLAAGKHRVEKLIVASSMSIYGEGAYACPHCGPVYPTVRSRDQLEAQEWEIRCPHCGQVASPAPTAETKPLFPTSVYAVTKRDQEELCLVVGRAYDIPTVALRYFNVYGPHQSLSNPYTGVAAIFISRLLNGNAPLIFEDGLQSRDFVHVSDIVQANLLAMESDAANYMALNVGTGRPTTILELAYMLARELDSTIEPEIVSKFREGDVRHCVADIALIQKTLGFTPRVSLETGLADLITWSQQQESEDQVNLAFQELERRGLAR